MYEMTEHHGRTGNTETRMNWKVTTKAEQMLTAHGLVRTVATGYAVQRNGWTFTLDATPGQLVTLYGSHASGRQVTGRYGSVTLAKAASVQFMHPAELMGWKCDKDKPIIRDVGGVATVEYAWQAAWGPYAFRTVPVGGAYQVYWVDRASKVKGEFAAPHDRAFKAMAADMLRDAYAAPEVAEDGSSAEDAALSDMLGRAGIVATSGQVSVLRAMLAAR